MAATNWRSKIDAERKYYHILGGAGLTGFTVPTGPAGSGVGGKLGRRGAASPLTYRRRHPRHLGLESRRPEW